MKSKQKKKPFLLIDKIVLGLNIVVAACLLLSYLAPGTDPRDSTIIATLGFVYLFLVAGNLVFLPYWLFRKPLLMLISVVCVLAGFNMATAQYGFRKKVVINDKADTSDLRIMQYNVHSFLGIGRYEDTFVQKEIMEVIESKHPDIINLEEFAKYRVNRDSISNQIKALLKTKYYYFNADKVFRKDSTGNAIFSKYPIVSTGLVGGNNNSNSKSIYVDVKYKGKTVRVYCVHLIAVQIKSKSKKKVLSGKALGNSSFVLGRLSGAFVMRSYQVDQIKKSFESCPYPYIVTGDFNDTPISYAVNELGDGLKNAFIEKGSGFQTTYWSSLPLQIDYILASKQFDVLNYQVLEEEISDHKPVISDLRLK